MVRCEINKLLKFRTPLLTFRHPFDKITSIKLYGEVFHSTNYESSYFLLISKIGKVLYYLHFYIQIENAITKEVNIICSSICNFQK